VDRLLAVRLAANCGVAGIWCRLEHLGAGWVGVILSDSGDELHRIETDEEAEIYIDEMFSSEE